MTKSAKRDAVTNLILEVFRVNGLLISSGDALVAPLGLTSARWQVLGAISYAGEPATVAQIARSMGLARQSVQRIVNALAKDAMLRFIDNPNHKRAKQVALTKKGETVYAAAIERQQPWAHALARGLNQSSLTQTCELLRVLRHRLEINYDNGDDQ